MAKKKSTKTIQTLKDPKLPVVIKAAYNVGRFDGRCENIDAVRREMAVAKAGLVAMAEEVKHLDMLDRGKVRIFIGYNMARACLAALRESKGTVAKQHAISLANKIKHAQGKS